MMIPKEDVVTHPFIFLDGWLTEQEIKDIEEYCTNAGTTTAEVIDSESKLSENSDIRKSKVKLHNVDDNNKWIFQKLLDAAAFCNNKSYKYDLLGFDYFQYTEYDGGEDPGFYVGHTDMVIGDNIPEGMVLPRKLSFSLILSDPSEYEGGEFEFQWGDKDKIIAEQPKGRLLVFPSWIMHRVKPVTKGKRRSLVFWVVGPRFK